MFLVYSSTSKLCWKDEKQSLKKRKNVLWDGEFHVVQTRAFKFKLLLMQNQSINQSKNFVMSYFGLRSTVAKRAYNFRAFFRPL